MNFPSNVLAGMRHWWANLDENWKYTFLKALGRVEYIHIPIQANYLRHQPRLVRYTSSYSAKTTVVHTTYRQTFIPDTDLYAILSIVDIYRVLNLRSLVVRNCFHLEPIRPLTQLTLLDCSNNPITDLGPLKELHQLRRLNCSNTLIHNLDPIYELPLLAYVDVRRTSQLEVYHILQLNAHRESLHIDSDFVFHNDPAPIVSNPSRNPTIDYYGYIVIGFIFILGIFIFQLFKNF